MRLLCLLAATAFVLGAPSAADAHAELVLASPEPGTGLAQAPAAVVIKFSEPLNLALSRIEVLNASGVDVGQGPTLAVAGDSEAMRRPLGLLPTGQYTVRWTSVSALDGHILQGSYFFAVGTEANPGTTLADSPLDSEGPAGLVGRFAELVALGTWLAWALLGRPSRRAGLDHTKIARVGRLAPTLAFAGALVSLLSATFVATGSLTAIGGVLASPSGEARLVVLAATAVGVIVWRSRPAAAGLAGAAIIAEAASGHAAASVLPLVAIGSFAIHLGAVGVWIYAIGASLLAAPSVRRAIGTFTPFAVGAAVLTAGTGLVNAVLELADPADLVQTGYGLLIVAKSLAFVLMVSFGFLQFVWRRRPAIDERMLRAPIRAEAIAAALALVLATLLTAFPNPPREAAASAASLTTNDPVLSELGGRDALSVADASGPFVVGLTILPPRPGPAEVRVQVLGVDAGDGLRNARFSARSGGVSTDVSLNTPCGLGCFAGEATFATAGDWQMKVEIDSNRGPISISEAVPLPTPDGSGALARTLTAEEGLKSALLTERLSGSVGGPTYVTTYQLQAPDRAEITLNDSTQILIGEQEFRRTGSGAWTESTFPAPGFSWPTGYFRDFWQGAVAIRMLGSATVDGVPCNVIAFLRPDVPAWFRIWVGQSDGIVRREEMRAEGHIMDHTYSELNGPITVTPPP
ncbi:MAG TPA: copper resistance protein CopC [Candidatus Saccharimonadales bacterium]|nr:copper resistance protein CopC [Candidatus Saccharimonadales bacterium]